MSVNNASAQQGSLGFLARLDNRAVFAFSLLVVFVALCFMPVRLTDTDLWFQMNQGREFFRNYSIPTSSFFSYIVPEQHWNNYSWLFQAVLYKTYEIGGYWGLIAGRALFVTFFGVLLFLLFVDRKGKSLIPCAIAMMLFFASMPRLLMFRPHVVTYLLLLAAILIFEKRKTYWLLPFLFILQANFHGIAYPFMIVVWFAYCAEYYYSVRFKGGKRIPLRSELVVLFAPLAMIANPYGASVFSLPFDNVASFVDRYIQEMLPFRTQDIFTFHFYPLRTLFIGTFAKILFVSSILAFVILLVQKNMRISYFVLFLFGVYLVLQSKRFLYISPIFFAPLFLNVTSMPNSKRFIRFDLFLAAVLLLVPLLFLYSILFSVPAKRPLSFIGIPYPFISFVEQLPPSKNILCNNLLAGYITFETYPDDKIFMDLELALFNDKIAYENIKCFQDEDVMTRHLGKYDVDLIYVPNEYVLQVSGFSAVADSYRPVFFDDLGVAFLLNGIAPELPTVVSLNRVLGAESASEEEAVTDEEFYSMVKSVASYDQRNFAAQVLLGNHYLDNGKPQEALAAAEELMTYSPENAAGFSIAGHAYSLLEQYDQALEAYQQAFKRPGTDERELLYRNYYALLVTLKRYDKAYDVLTKGFNPFSKDIPDEIVYELAVAAFNAHEWEDALFYVDIGLITLPPEDVARLEQLRDIRARIQKHN